MVDYLISREFIKKKGKDVPIIDKIIQRD